MRASRGAREVAQHVQRARAIVGAAATFHPKAARCAQQVGVTVLSMSITRFIPLAGWGEALSPGAHAERPSAAAAAAAPPAAALEKCAVHINRPFKSHRNNDISVQNYVHQ